MERLRRLIGLTNPEVNKLSGLSFEDADILLKKRSRTYRNMSERINGSGGYGFTRESQQYYGCWDAGRRLIAFRPDVRGALMVSVLAFEMNNAYNVNEHMKIDEDAREKRIDQEQFVEGHETIGYQGQLAHYWILKELNSAWGKLPEEMFIFSDVHQKTLAAYTPPDRESYLRAQNASGHSDHYRREYLRQIG